MRIGIDARFYSSSATGIGRYVYELISHVLAIDPKNDYVIFLNNPEFGQFVPPRRGVTKVLAGARHYSFDEQWHFWRILEKENLNLMHFTHFNAPILYRKPSIVTIHDLTLHFYPGEKMAGWFNRLAYAITIHSTVKRAKKIIAVSEHTKKDIVELLHVDPDKISVIYEGVNSEFHEISDTNIVDEFLEKSNFNKPYILYTGVWRNHKNLVNLIKAFAILKNEYKFQGSLVITGKEDLWYPEIKQAVKNEHLEEAVKFTGMVPDEDLVLLYNGASIYALPSLYEGFGLTILEAMACGVPVCAANSSSLPEICGKDNAVLFNPNNHEDMAAKIASVYKDPIRMKELSGRGLNRAKTFSWSKMAIETLRLYNAVMSS